RGQFKKISQHQVTVFGGNALRMKLNAMHGQALVHQPHYQTIGGFRIDRKRAWHAGALDNQRMVARCLQRPIDAAKHARAGVADFRYLAMKGCSAHHLPAKDLTDRLMAEAHTEDRRRRRGLCDEIKTNAGLIRRTGARREHDGVRRECHNAGDGNLVITVHNNVGPQPAKIMEKVEGEAVVIVDQDDHVSPLQQGFTVPSEGGQAAGLLRGYWPRLAALAKRRASSAARNRAFALLMHSCCSKSGSLSATIPAPA